MTFQRCERLNYKGVEHWLLDQYPFDQYLECLPVKPEICTHADSSLWRGYWGKWEIKEDKLFLVSLEAYLGDMDPTLPLDHEIKIDEVDLSHFFPDQKEVFADWFTGEISLPIYKPALNSFDGSECYPFDRRLILSFQEGILVNTYVKKFIDIHDNVRLN